MTLLFFFQNIHSYISAKLLKETADEILCYLFTKSQITNNFSAEWKVENVFFVDGLPYAAESRANCTDYLSSIYRHGPNSKYSQFSLF